MNATKQKQQAKEDLFFNEIYKNAKMGADTVINILPHIKNDALRSIVTMQLDGYEKYAAHAAEALAERGLCAKEENFVARGFARIGVALGTMVDSSTGRIAEIMIDSSNMCITEMTKRLGKKRFEELMEGLLIKPEGKPVLVPKDDERLELNTAQNDFMEEN